MSLYEVSRYDCPYCGGPSYPDGDDPKGFCNYCCDICDETFQVPIEYDDDEDFYEEQP